MCRFIAYLGQPIIMYDLLYKPHNSLIKQSVKAREIEEPLNGDGFGVGWYMADIDPVPGLFVSIHPAWNDRNLKSLTTKIKSDCIFAHVRAASSGYVNDFNCHPFQYKNFLFMHNGDIEGFELIEREMEDALSDEFYKMIQGQTDSEHFFALFLDKYYSTPDDENSTNKIANVLEDTIFTVQQMKSKYGIDSPTYLNAAITNGDEIVAIRYVSHSQYEPPTLYYSQGSTYTCTDNGVCEMRHDTAERSVLIVSEKLTDSPVDWFEIPPNHILIVDRKLHAVTRFCERALQVK